MTQQLESNWKQITERIILSCVILMVWGLFAIPTVFYGSLHLQVSLSLSIIIKQPYFNQLATVHELIDDAPTHGGLIYSCHGSMNYFGHNNILFYYAEWRK